MGISFFAPEKPCSLGWQGLRKPSPHSSPASTPSHAQNQETSFCRARKLTAIFTLSYGIKALVPQGWGQARGWERQGRPSVLLPSPAFLSWFVVFGPQLHWRATFLLPGTTPYRRAKDCGPGCSTPHCPATGDQGLVAF